MEALKHAKKTEKYLKKTKRNLGRAKLFGLLDALGGKLPIDLVKNFFFKRAKKHYEKSNKELRKIRLGLHQLNLGDNPVNMSFALGLLDLFSRDPLSDWMALSEIASAKKKVKARLKEVKDLRKRLEQMSL